MGGCAAQDVANAVRAFASSEVKGEVRMGAVARRTGEMLREFNAQGLANTVWAFAELEVAGEVPMGAVAFGTPHTHQAPGLDVFKCRVPHLPRP